jgi:hypothetical protein
MATPAFATGTRVEWRGHVGEIRFVDDIYLTICVSVNPEDRARDVCLVVQKWDWNEIMLVKESTK